MENENIKTSLMVNGVSHPVVCKPFDTLLTVLREDLGYFGTKFGCGIGYCGACTVLIDGNSAHSCCLIATTMSDRKISTIESCDDDPVIQKIQDQFLKEGAIQCGYCIPGIVMTVRGLIEESGQRVITEEILRGHLDGNICRCSGYASIVRASLKACVDE